MKLLISGGRNYTISEKGLKLLDDLHKKHNFSLLINGCATGIDSSAMAWARKNNIPIKESPAKWNDLNNVPPYLIKKNKYGKPYNATAGINRNIDMLKEVWQDYDGLIIVFPGGLGSSHMLRICLDIDANVLNWMNRMDLINA